MSFRRIRLLTAGESHGSALSAILEGLPAHLPVLREELQHQMKRRQQGYGRGARMMIETDEVEITGGVRFGKTTGSPIGLLLKNVDFANWREEMDVWAPPEEQKRAVHRPRPGHADLAGGLKYDEHDLRNILERASARESAIRTAAGALCRQLLERAGIRIGSHVVCVGSVETKNQNPDWEAIWNVQDSDRMRCVDHAAEEKMMMEVDEARKQKETLGGVFQIVATNVPPGLGSHIHWDQKIDARIAQAMLSIPAVKGVAIGDAFHIARSRGSSAHDEIYYEMKKGFYRKTNRAGGTEGGITNGEEIRILAAMKPLSTLMKPLASVDVLTKQKQDAVVERSDVCAVPAAGVVGEAMLALVLADALLEKFASDTLAEFLASLEFYRRKIAEY